MDFRLRQHGGLRPEALQLKTEEIDGADISDTRRPELR
jgi:hypothetical protein